jgi:hypothetical protein
MQEEASPVISLAEMQSSAGFAAVDYLHYVFSTEGVAPDALTALLDFLSPQFAFSDGRALVTSVGAERRYGAYRLRQSPEEAQYWANLTEISGVFERMRLPDVLAFAKLVAICWNAQLGKHPDAVNQEARILEDEELGEIFVTLMEKGFTPQGATAPSL